MPVVYDEIFWISALVILSLSAFILAKLLTNRTKMPRVLTIFIALVTSSIITIFLWFPVAIPLSHKVQAMIAEPYIQEALDENCAAYEVAADINGFYTNPRPYGEGDSPWSTGTSLLWQSENELASCNYSVAQGEKWICTCS